MIELKHTKGPWKYQEASDAYTHIVRSGDRFIVQLGQSTKGEEEANARLIAAAPDMIGMLINMYRAYCYDSDGFSLGEKQELKEVIELATGMKIEEVLS